MRIDATTGSVSFISGTLRPELVKSDFLATELGLGARKVLENEGWVQLNFEAEPGVGVTALFKDDNLHQVFVTFQLPGDDDLAWTEPQELERKARHDEWLFKELGAPPYKYSWGSVVSDFDLKDRVSDIIVTYSK
jgi:hypothetical protein